MQKGEDPYEILGVPQNCDYLILLKAYRRLALATHPQRKQGDSHRFAQIANAYELLRFPPTRHNYDLYQRYGPEKHLGYDPRAPDFPQVSPNYDPSQPEHMWQSSTKNKHYEVDEKIVDDNVEEDDEGEPDMVQEESWVTYTSMVNGKPVTQRRKTKFYTRSPSKKAGSQRKAVPHTFQIDPLDLFAEEYPEGWKPHVKMKKKKTTKTKSSTNTSPDEAKKSTSKTKKTSSKSKSKSKSHVKGLQTLSLEDSVATLDASESSLNVGDLNRSGHGGAGHHGSTRSGNSGNNSSGGMNHSGSRRVDANALLMNLSGSRRVDSSTAMMNLSQGSFGSSSAGKKSPSQRSKLHRSKIEPGNTPVKKRRAKKNSSPFSNAAVSTAAAAPSSPVSKPTSEKPNDQEFVEAYASPPSKVFQKKIVYKNGKKVIVPADYYATHTTKTPTKMISSRNRISSLNTTPTTTTSEPKTHKSSTRVVYKNGKKVVVEQND